jgi:hypothetical protein
LQAIDAIFQSIEKSTLECVFQEWMADWRNAVRQFMV